VKKYENWSTIAEVIVQIKVACFFETRGIISTGVSRNMTWGGVKWWGLVRSPSLRSRSP